MVFKWGCIHSRVQRELTYNLFQQCTADIKTKILKYNDKSKAKNI